MRKRNIGLLLLSLAVGGQLTAQKPSIEGVAVMKIDETKSFSVAADEAVAAYRWTAPNGCRVTAGQGTNAVEIVSTWLARDGRVSVERAFADEHRDTPIEEAKKMGAVALFGEKYGDKVRVVRFGPSVEFCGGIHAHSTGRIGMFKIISESSVAAGIRRIEAKTGRECEQLLYNLEDMMKGIKALFNNAKDLKGVIEKYIEEHDTMKKRIEQYQAEAVERTKDKLISQARQVNGVTIVTAVIPMKQEAAKDLVFKVRTAVPEHLLCVVGSVYEDRPTLSVMISDDLVADHALNAGKMVREAAKLIQGGGGGQPHFATAGGKNADGLSAAVDKVVELANL